ncbi:DUF4132 domain-containing protein [Pendulispora rubella]|uniref:DUF4132 domain-containing protein n=1 Tax=Pendulispora rubella TaxID=2741070 RepID=A0ABZ2LH39_9BACT
MGTRSKQEPRAALGDERRDVCDGGLEAAMLEGRPMTLEAIRGDLAGGALVVRAADGTLAMVTASTIMTPAGVPKELEESAALTVVHPADLTDAERGALWILLVDGGALQPILQLARAVHRVAEKGSTSVTLPVRGGRSAKPFWKKGWKPIFEEEGWDRAASESEKEYPFFGLKARWEHAPTIAASWESYEHPQPSETETLSFTRDGAWISLGEVPARLYSEVVCELVPESAAEVAARKRLANTARKPKEELRATTFDRVSDRILQLRSSRNRAIDAGRAIERLGDAAIRTVELIATAKAADTASLARALGCDLAEAEKTLLAIESAISKRRK